MAPHPLDRAIWHALTTRQASFAEVRGAAARYRDHIGPLAGTRDDSPAALSALASLVPADDMLAVFHFGARALEIPAPAMVDSTAAGVQMVLDTLHPVATTAEPVELTDADAPEMLALATLTRPGPFRTGTHRLGTFWGIRQEGRLVAMAGERLKLPGYTEVSGVCTHPAARGRGYAAQLTRHVASRIVERGEQPFLHAYADNEGAVRIYRAIGFTLRSRLTVLRLRRG